MALVRILVDGYSLLHAWPELAPGALRHSARAREELIQVLTGFHDATGDPLTIFFDGSGAPPGTPKSESSRGVEILFSGPGQTADDLIERATHRFQDYGEVLVVTNDHAERDTVSGFGGSYSSCENFIRRIGGAMGDLAEDLEDYNRRQREAFRRAKRPPGL
jgi:predicted RNA-binding protein with PIN domain